MIETEIETEIETSATAEFESEQLYTGGGSQRETLHRGALRAGGGLETSRMGLTCYMRAVSACYMRSLLARRPLWAR